MATTGNCFESSVVGRKVKYSIRSNFSCFLKVDNLPRLSKVLSDTSNKIPISPLFCLQLVHPLPQLVDQRLLLLLEGVFKLDLLPPEAVEAVLLRRRLRLQLLDPAHQLVDQTLLLLLQRVLELDLLMTQLNRRKINLSCPTKDKGFENGS